MGFSRMGVVLTREHLEEDQVLSKGVRSILKEMGANLKDTDGWVSSAVDKVTDIYRKLQEKKP